MCILIKEIKLNLKVGFHIILIEEKRERIGLSERGGRKSWKIILIKENHDIILIKKREA